MMLNRSVGRVKPAFETLGFISERGQETRKSAFNLNTPKTTYVDIVG